jgi:hypothetical protein
MQLNKPLMTHRILVLAKSYSMQFLDDSYSKWLLICQRQCSWESPSKIQYMHLWKSYAKRIHNSLSKQVQRNTTQFSTVWPCAHAHSMTIRTHTLFCGGQNKHLHGSQLQWHHGLLPQEMQQQNYEQIDATQVNINQHLTFRVLISKIWI